MQSEKVESSEVSLTDAAISKFSHRGSGGGEVEPENFHGVR